MVVLFFKCTVESGICKFLLNLDFDHSMERLQGSQHSQKYRGNPDFSNHPGKKQIWRIECKITVFVWWRVRFELPEISKTRGFKKSGFCCKSHCAFHHTAHKQLSANGRTGTFGLGGGGEGRGGEGGPFCRKKINNARILEFVIGIQKHLYCVKRKNVYNSHA